MFVPRRTCLLSTNRTAKQQVQPIPGLPISALWDITKSGFLLYQVKEIADHVGNNAPSLSLLQNLRSSPSLRPPPAFVCPQPIASSVKNGSLMHLEGDETFIAGLFLFFFFFHYGMERARINISMALPAHRVSVWVFSAAFSNGHKCRQVASK